MIKKNDIKLLMAFIAISVIILLIITFSRHKGKTAAVYIDGVKEKSFDLSENTEYTIETEEGYNILKIEDGTAYLIDADCPDKLCVNEGKISKTGQSIVCLPHKVVISIEGEEDEEGVDVVVK